MKKRIFWLFDLLIVVCMAAVCLTACSDRTGEEEAGEDAAQEVVFTIENVEEKGSEEYLEWDFQLPKITGTPVAEKIARELNSEKEEFMKTARETAAEIGEAVKSGDDWGVDMSAYCGARWDYTQQGNVVTVLVNWSTYLGGAHGGSSLQTITFTVDDGKIYDFNDIFKDAEGIDFVKNYISAAVSKEPELYYESAADDVKTFDNNLYNFYFNGESLYVAFNPYVIAPYAAGIVSFEIPFEESEKYLDDAVREFIRDSEPKEISEYVVPKENL
ncbi:MAG: DUF3298 and DUF4163 domain-containing protein [Clostridia bacterium]|nr:DUF3298 and DUF4163 domain-containing protein [Clostridia bacterium]